MSFRRVEKDRVFFTEQQSNSASPLKLGVSDFRHCIIQIATSNSFVGSIFIAGAIGASAPTFTWTGSNADNTHDNPFSFLQAINLEDGSAVDGDTGVELNTSADTIRLYEVNINAVDWLTVFLTARQAGSVSIKATVATNA